MGHCSESLATRPDRHEAARGASLNSGGRNPSCLGGAPLVIGMKQRVPARRGSAAGDMVHIDVCGGTPTSSRANRWQQARGAVVVARMARRLPENIDIVETIHNRRREIKNRHVFSVASNTARRPPIVEDSSNGRSPRRGPTAVFGD